MDQTSRRFLADQRLMGEEQQRWISKLIGFDFEIKYKPGIENKAVDALSGKLQFSALLLSNFMSGMTWQRKLLRMIG